MPRPLKPATPADVRAIERALVDIRSCVGNLRVGGADQAARKVAKVAKSVEGALRHAYRREYRTQLAKGGK